MSLMMKARMRTAAIPLTMTFLIALAPSQAQAQRADAINIYRYVLDVDVPESPGLVALDAVSPKVLRGSSPKPITANVVLHSSVAGRAVTGAALDFVPYHLLGGGIRPLASYRANSLTGRLLRVVTKTSMSFAAASDPTSSGSLRGALGIRATFHDPHDPVLNSRLPETIDSVLKSKGVSVTDPSDEDLTEKGVDLQPYLAAARRQMRARGDVQISAGWGLAGQIAGASLDGDSLQDFRHTLWVTGQHATGHRFDFLATAQYRNAFRGDGALRFGLGIQRKSTPADLRLELYYDDATSRVHPGATIDVRAGHGLGVSAGLSNDSPANSASDAGQVRMFLVLQWYSTAQR